MGKELINLSNLQRFLSKLNEKFALKKTMKGISEDTEGNIIIGEEGLVPTPDENSKGKFLRSDGEWALPSVYDSMTLEEGVAGVSKVDRVINAKNLKQIVNSDGFLTSLDSSKLTGIINIENLPQGALERILIVSSKEERLTLLDTEVQLGDVVKESDTGLMYYVINTEKLNSEEGYTQFTAGSASSVPWSGVTGKPLIPTKTSELTNDSDFAIDSGVVHKTGNETIDGVKTFTASPFVSNNATTNGYSIKLNAVARNEVPSELYHATFRAHDKNSKILGEYCVEKSTTGCTLLNMNVRSEDSNGKQLSQSLYFNMSNDGSAVSFYPNSNNKVDLGMSNHKWAKIYSDDVVHTSGNETIAGNKTFSNKIKGNLQGNADTSTYATSAGSANSVAWANVTGKPSIPTTTPNAYVTASWRSGSNWYRKWSNGFIEQGGVANGSNLANVGGFITLPAPFSNANYVAMLTPSNNEDGFLWLGNPPARHRTSTATTLRWGVYDGNAGEVYWYACGY